ncbi:MAG: bifunctional 4-hydroxy-2-oxoglutarate aldolase/2-dehydro-3-deoxy-phosphogluconate aldolase [Planctomycetes bacterium]|nr:bifunctional 4-hydroxy-2-oxoglutarate aldolase/2-dehydro-3-deoxy-phosphogluconate aldolase [Planctomycetota bacterium]
MFASHPHPLIDTFARERCSAILRTPHARAVGPAMQAAIDGGFRIVEFTLTSPGALDEIARFARQKDLVVGAGTVLTTLDAERSIDAGARFIVSPVADPEVIRWCVEREILVIPGCFTPTEMLMAHRLGAPIVKLFPGPAEGPAYVRSCRLPLPFLRIFPTAGVTEDNVAAWLAAGSFGVGWVGALFLDEDLATGRFDAVRARAQRMIEKTRATVRA